MVEFDVGILSFLPADATQFGEDALSNLLVARNMLILGQAYGVRMGLFSTDHFLCRDGQASAMACFWDGSSLRWEQAVLPPILENIFPASEKVYRNVPAAFSVWLKKQPLLNGASLPKQHVASALILHGYGAYMIPTKDVASFSDLRAAVALWKHCVVKPASGRKGLGVSYLEQQQDGIYYRNTDDSGLLTEDAWDGLCARYPSFTRYLLQPQLDFHCADGHALDFRLLVSKGGTGHWETVAIYARIGAGSIVSNVSRGGYIGSGAGVLKEEFPDASDRLLDTLKLLAEQVPQIVESYCKEPVSCYGIDVGIDRGSLCPYVIEVNTFPGTRFHAWQLAEKRVQYFKYLLQSGKSSR